MRAEASVAELFAGVGGFRLGLEGHPLSSVEPTGWRVAWSNQWEPSTKRQHASDCYSSHFGGANHTNLDIAKVLDEIEEGRLELPSFDLLVGGFPCQDYSVARVLNQAAGLQGKKGVLWWEIHRLIRGALPRFVFLENVDRLLKSPASQRGRDFAVMLRCLSDLDYWVEWRVVNAADYGFPQRRRRVLIVGERVVDPPFANPLTCILKTGVLASSLPVQLAERTELLPISPPPSFQLAPDLADVSEFFSGQFENAGVAFHGDVWTVKVQPDYSGPREVLRDKLQTDDEVPDEFFIPRSQVKEWMYLKGAKDKARVAASGFKYFYSEGAIAFPDPLDQPSRTILTGEGGAAPSRFKHVVTASNGRLRRLTPVELERLNGFPDDWTKGMPVTRRAFMMGNALVVGLVRRVAGEIATRAGLEQQARDVSARAAG